MFLYFIDYQKALYRVQYDKLVQVINQTNIEEKEFELKSKAILRIDEENIEPIEINREVCQGYILSPIYFNIY